MQLTRRQTISKRGAKMGKMKKPMYVILVVIIAFLNYSFLSEVNYFFRILIRFPQILLMLFLYVKIFDIKLTERKRVWQMPKTIHILLLVIGTLELAATIAFSIVQANINVQTVGTNLQSFDFQDPLIIATLIIGSILYVPIAYTFLQYAFLTYRLTLWVYLNKKSLLLPLIIAEDLLITCYYSIFL